jgi:hypothetical protein
MRMENHSSHETGLAFWERLESEEHANLERSHSARTRVAWRLVRNLALMQGKLVPDRPLEEAERLHEESPLVPEVRANLPFDLRAKPVTVLPTLGTSSLVEWQAAMLVLAEQLGCDSLCRNDPITNALPTYWGLLDLEQLHNTFPPFSALCNYENKVLDRLSDLLMMHGTYQAAKKLQKQLKLTQNEVRMLFSILRYNVKSLLLDGNDPEEERAMLLIQVQDVRQRARLSLNLREEMNALKLETVLRGLNRTEETNLSTIFGKVVDSIASIKPPVLQLPTAVPDAAFDEVEGPAEDGRETA